MPMIAVAAAVAVGATVMATMSSMSAASAQKKAVKQQVAAQQEAQRIEQARANVLAQRDRVAQIREDRIRRANIIASAGNAGLGVGPTNGGSSGISGATGSVRSQFGQNMGTLGQMSDFAAQITAANQREAQAQSDFYNAGAKGQMWQSIFGAVGSVAGAGMNALGGAKGAGMSAGGGNTFKSIFE